MTDQAYQQVAMPYRKKPVVIVARRFETDEDARLIKEWANQSQRNIEDFPGGRLAVHTLEGVMSAERGDWIICGVKGEFYPCKDEIFRASYEPA